MNNNEKYKVLIVDDEKINVIALAQILKPQYDIIVAIDGATAIEAAEKHVPDIILLDILMPDMSGFDVIPILKESEITKNIPVIFITGLSSVEDEEKGLLLGAVDYITKPFHKSIVKARLRTHLKMSGYTQTIEKLCMMDALTELSNRRGFDNRMGIEWARAVRDKTSLSILMIDIDKFKIYNDTYGHPQGDFLLQSIANIFKRTLNRPADFAARWGGEEFIVLLPNTDLNGASKVAEQIRQKVEQAVIPCGKGTNTSVTVSIGVSSKIPGVNDSVVEFISQADQALYYAKNGGRNRTCTY